jgi:hypothetical protein
MWVKEFYITVEEVRKNPNYFKVEIYLKVCIIVFAQVLKITVHPVY